MPVLVYIAPPISGLVAYLRADSAEARAHGLQSVVLGVAWPGVLLLAARVSVGAAQIAVIVGAILWVTLLLAAARGRAPLFPPLRRMVED